MTLIELIGGLSEYLVAVAYLLTLFGFAGAAVLLICNLDKHISFTSLLLLSPAVGVSFLTTVLVFVAHHEIGISYQVVWSLMVAVIALGVLRVGTLRRFGVLPLEMVLQRWWVWGLSLVALSSAGLLPYFFLLVKRDFPTGLGTSVTWTNNDLGVYIQMATNVAKTGIKDAGLVTGWNAGAQASFDHPAAHSFFAAVSRLLFREPYQSGIILIAVVTACLIGSAVAIVKTYTANKGSFALFFSALVVVINPPVLGAVANFFFPQLLSVGLTVTYFALALILLKSKNPIQYRNHVPGLFLVVSTLFVSVEIAIVLIPLFIFFASVECGIRESLPKLLKSTYFVFPALAILVLMEFDLFRSQFEIFTKMNSAGVAGWKSNFVSLSMIIGITPSEFGGPYGVGTRLTDVLLVALVVGGIIVFSRKGLLHLRAVGGIFILGLMVAAAVMRWGVDAYQTWKLVTTLTPVFYILLLIIFCRLQSRPQKFNLLPLTIAIVSASLVWSAQIWAQTSKTSYLNEELIQISRLKVTRSQTALNILISPYFETMAASVMTGVPTHLASPSYFFFQGQELLYRCTLTTRSRLRDVPNAGPIVAERGDYLLVGSPQCD